MKTRILITLLLLLVAVLPAAAQDDTPPMLGVHGFLAESSPLNGEFDGKAEAAGMHLYAFEGVTGDVVSLSMNALGGEIDPFLVLLAEDGTLLNFDDDSGGNLNSLLTAELPADGLYFVLAASSYHSLFLPENYAGQYEITLSGATASGTDTETLLTEVDLPEIGWDDTLTAEIQEETPFFLATLTVQDSAAADVSAISDDLDTLLYVFGAEGERLGIDDDGAGYNYSSALSAVSLDEPGKYLILVTHRNFLESLVTGSFELSVSRAG